MTPQETLPDMRQRLGLSKKLLSVSYRELFAVFEWNRQTAERIKPFPARVHCLKCGTSVTVHIVGWGLAPAASNPSQATAGASPCPTGKNGEAKKRAEREKEMFLCLLKIFLISFPGRAFPFRGLFLIWLCWQSSFLPTYSATMPAIKI